MITEFKLFERKKAKNDNLHTLIYNYDLEGIREFALNGGNLNNRFGSGDNPLCYCINYRVEIAELLIELGANVNLSSKDGNHALIYAMQRNRKELIDLIINNDNFKPNLPIVEYVNDDGVKEFSTYLEHAITRKRARTVYQLLKVGAKVSYDNIRRASTKSDNMVQKLIENADDSVLKEVDEESGETLLFTVSYDSMLLLLKRGVDMTITDNKGKYFFEDENKDLLKHFEIKLKEQLPEQFKIFTQLKNMKKYKI